VKRLRIIPGGILDPNLPQSSLLRTLQCREWRTDRALLCAVLRAPFTYQEDIARYQVYHKELCTSASLLMYSLRYDGLVHTCFRYFEWFCHKSSLREAKALRPSGNQEKNTCLCSELEKREGPTLHAFHRDLPSTPFAFRIKGSFLRDR
jgi:hypothetical protein